MAVSTTPRTRTRGGVTDKRTALLEAATRLFAIWNGLQSVPTSAIAREAGVAKGTLFVYFETKEQLLNELYLELANRYMDAVRASRKPMAPANSQFRAFWFAFARWYLDHGDAATVMLQCEVSSVLTPETQAIKDDRERGMMRDTFPELLKHYESTPLRYVGYALIAGPIQVLAQMRDKGEIDISDELLEQTFTRVEKALFLHV